MAITLPVQADQIKLRWQEPYVSAALNHKNFKTMPRGVYRGFLISPNGGKTIRIDTENGTGYPVLLPGQTPYLGGNFDAAIAGEWSVAVHESLEGFGCTVLMQRGINSAYDFDLTAYAGGVVYAALSVSYQLGYATTATLGIYTGAELDANPTLLCLGRIEVPAGVDIEYGNIAYDDALFPRVRPYANEFKDGFMSSAQAEIVRLLEVPGASNAFVEEITVSIAGPQVIPVPMGNTYVIGGNDLLIFRNGNLLTKGRDYLEIDRGDGKGEEVDITAPLRMDDRILFRGQQYAVSLTNTLTVEDEYGVVGQNVTTMNFQGTGVLVLPDGLGRVRVIIPEVSGAGSPSRLKKNNSAFDIPRGRAVHLLSDGSVIPCDPRDPTHRVFGVTTGAVVSGNFGTVVIAGSAENALLGIGGFVSGDRVYVSHSGVGDLTATPPNPNDGAVFQVGIADCPTGTESSSPTDVVMQIQRLI